MGNDFKCEICDKMCDIQAKYFKHKTTFHGNQNKSVAIAVKVTLESVTSITKKQENLT